MESNLLIYFGNQKKHVLWMKYQVTDHLVRWYSYYYCI